MYNSPIHTIKLYKNIKYFQFSHINPWDSGIYKKKSMMLFKN